jgi:hypothetical protein
MRRGLHNHRELSARFMKFLLLRNSQSYDLGGFDVQTWADLRCHGVVVPKTEL